LITHTTITQRFFELSCLFCFYFLNNILYVHTSHLFFLLLFCFLKLLFNNFVQLNCSEKFHHNKSNYLASALFYFFKLFLSTSFFIWQDFFTMDTQKRGLCFDALKTILTILSSLSSSFFSRRFNMAIYFSLKVDLYCHIEMTRGKTR
jgi:hypothetical protein